MGCQELKLDLTMSPTPVKWPAALIHAGDMLEVSLVPSSSLESLLVDLKRGASHVYVNAFSPGNIPTGAMDTRKDLFGTIGGSAIKGLFQIVGQSPAQAAATAIYLATSPKVQERQQKGKYFIPIATEDKTSKLALDKDLAKNLWYWCDDKVTKALGKGWEEGAALALE